MFAFQLSVIKHEVVLIHSYALFESGNNHNSTNNTQQSPTSNQDADDDEYKTKFEIDDCIVTSHDYWFSTPTNNIKRLHKNSNIKEVSIAIIPPPPLLNS